MGLSNNKLQRMINGNRGRFGFKLAVWNCDRGLLGADGASSKFQDIKQFIFKNKPHLFGIIETDIFSPLSNHHRVNKFDMDTVKSMLNISGYSIEFPATWDTMGQARMLVYVSNDIIYEKKGSNNQIDDLPTITF